MTICQKGFAMNFSVNNIREQVKVHTGGGKVKIVIRVTGTGQRSFFDEEREIRIYTRTLVLGDDLRIKKIYEDTNGDCWFSDISKAKRIADRYGRREGQKVVLIDTKDRELANAFEELERILNRRPRPRPPVVTAPSRRDRPTAAGAVIGGIIGTIIGGAIGAATSDD